jgi:hypothetical protein
LVGSLHTLAASIASSYAADYPSDASLGFGYLLINISRASERNLVQATDKEMTYRVYQYDAADNAHDTGKEFSITIEESNAQLVKAYRPVSSVIQGYSVMMVMFDKLYGFTLQSGFNLNWTTPMVEGTIAWRTNDWQIKRVK